MLYISLLSFVFAIAADPTITNTTVPENINNTDDDVNITTTAITMATTEPTSDESPTTNESSNVSPRPTEPQISQTGSVSTILNTTLHDIVTVSPTTTDMLDGSGDISDTIDILAPSVETTTTGLPPGQVASSLVTTTPPFILSATLLMLPTNTPVTKPGGPKPSSNGSPAEPSQDPNLNDETAKIGAAIGVASFVLVTLIVILCGLICCYHMFK